MKPTTLLRIASGCMIFHLLGHTMGHSQWKEGAEPARKEVVQKMLDNKFEFMGVSRSYGDYYMGYGWNLWFVLLMLALILWGISKPSQENPSFAIKVLFPILICLSAFSVLDYLYFFPLVAITCLVAAIAVGTAILQLRKSA